MSMTNNFEPYIGHRSLAKATQSFTSSRSRFWASIIRWRWGIVILTTLLVGTIELQRYPPESLSNLWGDLFFIFSPYNLVYPILVAVVLSHSKTKLELRQTTILYSMRNELCSKLINAQDYYGTAEFLFHFLLDHVPIAGLLLIEYDRTQGQVRLLGELSHQKAMTETLLEANDFKRCLTALKPHDGVVIPLPLSCDHSHSDLFCLSLAEDVYQMTVLVLYQPIYTSYNPFQLKLLNGFAPEIAASIERIRLLSLVSQSKQALRKEQSRIARYLHDSISGNLAYISLKLDQLSDPEEQTDIKTLHNLAVETYERVRCLLTDLHPISEPLELTTALYKTAMEIGERANFQVHFKSIGEPLKLRAAVERQILYVAREILRNVEKHAGARQVIFALTWRENSLKIETTDDGQGFEVGDNGFEPGHLGLQIIHEIAEELKGQFTITSSEEGGTKLILWIPND